MCRKSYCTRTFLDLSVPEIEHTEKVVTQHRSHLGTRGDGDRPERVQLRGIGLGEAFLRGRNHGENTTDECVPMVPRGVRSSVDANCVNRQS